MITRKEIEEVIHGFLDADPWNLITPGMVYHTLGKRGRCCGCFPGLIDLIISTSERYHLEMETPASKLSLFISRIKIEYQHYEESRHLAKQRVLEIGSQRRSVPVLQN